MIEAVGHQYFGEFFRRCAARLVPRRTRCCCRRSPSPTDHYERARDEVDFIKRYIFPGCCIPSVSALRAGDGGVERPAHRAPRGHRPALRDDAARWRENFLASLDDVRALGYSDELRPHVGVLPLLLRGGLRGARARRRADAARAR